MHLICYFHSCITMHGFMNVKSCLSRCALSSEKWEMSCTQLEDGDTLIAPHKEVHKHVQNDLILFLISYFRGGLNVAFFLLGDYPASEFYMPTFRNILFHLHRRYLHRLWRWNRQSVPKRLDIKFRYRGITQKKEYYPILPRCLQKPLHALPLVKLHILTL